MASVLYIFRCTCVLLTLFTQLFSIPEAHRGVVLTIWGQSSTMLQSALKLASQREHQKYCCMEVLRYPNLSQTTWPKILWRLLLSLHKNYAAIHLSKISHRSQA